MIARLVLALVLIAAATAAPAQQPPAGPPPVVTRDAFGEEIMLPARTMIFKKGTAKWDQAWPTVVEAFKAVRAAVDKVGAKVNGPAFLIYQATDDDGFEFEAGFPVEAAPATAPGGDIQVGPAPAGPALKFVHRGAFDGMETLYESIANLLDAKGLPSEESFIEEFVTDPLTAKPDALVINVYVPVKGK
jgi:effector-binding domain-containing protein